MLRLEWTTPAADQFEAAQTNCESLNPLAAQTLAKRVADAALLLCERPLAGRTGLREDTREWVVQRTPYLLVYRCSQDTVEILHVWSAGQDLTHYEN